MKAELRAKRRAQIVLAATHQAGTYMDGTEA